MKKRFLPDFFLDSVFSINQETLKARGICALIFDIDNTLAEYETPVPDEKTAEWMNGLRENGFKIYFVSNNTSERVQKFAESANAPYIARAAKPLSLSLRKACRNMNVTFKQTALVGDQIFTDIWGGNRLGMCTILVHPISDKEGNFIKFKRKLEQKILKNMPE